MREDSGEALDVQFRAPESYVLSVRLNRAESSELTEAARRAGQKLSTYLKAAALESARRNAGAAPAPRTGGHARKAEGA